MSDIETVSRITIDGEATLGGLLALIGKIPSHVPNEAEITWADHYFGCPPEALEDHDIEHEHGPRLEIALEWSAS